MRPTGGAKSANLSAAGCSVSPLSSFDLPLGASLLHPWYFPPRHTQARRVTSHLNPRLPPAVKSPKNYVILLLALTTVGGAALAWHEYQEIVSLRAAVADAKDRADEQAARLAALEKSNHGLQSQVASARHAAAAAQAAVAQEEEQSGPDNRRNDFRARMRARFAAVREAMAKPEVQAMIASERKAGIEARYAALFRNLNLTADQADKLAGLLADRQSAVQDVWAAARDQGVNPRSDPAGFQNLIAQAQASVDDSIKSLIGDSGYSQLQNYDATMPQRNVVDTLQQRLSYSDSPLTAQQADQLVQILASNAPTASGATTTRTGPTGGFGGRMMGAFGGPGGGVVGRNAAPITPAAVSQASSILAQPQVTALQQLQQQQQTAQQIQQIIRNTIRQNASPGAGAAGGRTGGG